MKNISIYKTHHFSEKVQFQNRFTFIHLKINDFKLYSYLHVLTFGKWRCYMYLLPWWQDWRHNQTRVSRKGNHRALVTNKHALTRLYLFTRSKPGQHVWMYNVMLINSLRTLTLWSHVEPFIDGNINSTSNNVWLTIDNKASERSPQSKSQRLQPNLSTFPRNMQAIWIN